MGERFEDYAIVFDRPLAASMRLLAAEGLVSNAREQVLAGQDRLLLDRSIFDRVDTMVFDDLQVSDVSLLHQEVGHGVRMEFRDFPGVAFWTKSGTDAPFVCLELWHGCAALEDESGIFSEKPGCVWLLHGEERTCTYAVAIR